MSTWLEIIEDSAQKFKAIATTHNLVTWAEESQFAIQAIQKNEKLAQCIPHTVQNAVINVAAVGLTLNPALGYAYLVPESEKIKEGGREQWVQCCNLRVSFKGLLKIATDSGSILWAKAEIVKKNDLFKYCGPCELPKHEMEPFGDRGEVVGVYCVAKTHQGDYLVDVMSAAEIAKIRAAAKQDGVWAKWPEEMAKKAILKRASKQWPKTDRTDRLDRAIAVVNEYEGSDERDITPQESQEEINARFEEVITEIKIGIDKGELARAADAWYSLPDEDKALLWKAPSKGGAFTTKEREIMKSSEFREAKQALSIEHQQ